MDRLIFGALEPSQQPHSNNSRTPVDRAAFETTLSDKIIVDIWAKFARSVGLQRHDVGHEVFDRPRIADPDLLAMLQRALRESIAVARGRQIPLPAKLFDEI